MKLHHNVTNKRTIKAFHKFATEAPIFHGNTFNYDEAVFKGMKIPIWMTCTVCDTRKEIVPDTHRNKRCSVCTHRQNADDQRYSIDDFLEKSKRIHGDIFGYDKAVYEANNTQLIVTCPIHGDFEITPTGHWKSKTGCTKCGAEQSWDFRGLTTQAEFLTDVVTVHGDKYSYSKLIFVGYQDKIEVLCKEHGSFWQMPMDHKIGRGCPDCGNITQGLSQRSSTKEFIERAVSIHNGYYSYENVEYITNADKVDITCPVHGSFWQTPSIHWNGAGCPDCTGYGFSPSAETKLYYLKVTKFGVTAFKIGLTIKTVNDRFGLKDMSNIEVIDTLLFKRGSDAYAAEQSILKKYKKKQYTGVKLLSSGNTELFSIDVLNSTLSNYKLKE